MLHGFFIGRDTLLRGANIWDERQLIPAFGD